MSKAKDRKERRKSTARNRAEKRGSGFETTTLKMPEGLNFWEIKTGVTKQIDIIPYIVGKGNPYAEEGELHYERTFFHYRSIGIEEKNYICSSKTFAKKDYIQEWRQKKSKDPTIDSKLLKDLTPKERQIFLVYDHDDKAKGVQLWEFSFHNFGSLLDSRVKKAPESRGWDLFYFPDNDGMTLELTFVESSGGGFKFAEVIAIDFLKREGPIPKEIVEHGICLDDLLVETPYEELKNIFLMGDSDDSKKETDDESFETTTVYGQESGQETTSTSQKQSTADDFGLSKDDDVKYEGNIYTIFRISEDGTSLTLVNDDDEIVKAVSPDEVELIKDTPKEDNEPVSQSEDKNEREHEENWDEDWD